MVIGALISIPVEDRIRYGCEMASMQIITHIVFDSHNIEVKTINPILFTSTDFLARKLVVERSRESTVYRLPGPSRKTRRILR